MLPKYHVVYGFLVGLILYFGLDVSWVGCLVFWGSSFLIDVDHYLYYVWRKRDWSLVRARRWFGEARKKMREMDLGERRKFYSGFYFLHGVEILILIFILGYFVWEMFYFVGLGILFHLLLDYIEQAIWRGRFDKVSAVWDFFKYKRLNFVGDLRKI